VTTGRTLIQIASWSTGHTLSRFLFLRADGQISPARPVFQIYDPDGQFLFSIEVNPLDRLGKGFDEVKIRVPEPEQRPSADYLLHRKLIVSALVEVLGLPVNRHMAQGPLVSPISKWPDHIQTALQHTSRLDALASAMEVATSRAREGELRRDYMNLTIQQLEMVPIDGPSDWFRNANRQDPLYVPSTTVKRDIRGSNWCIGFKMTFDREVICSVYVRHKDDTGREDPAVMLGQSNVSMLQAILNAGLIIPAAVPEGATHIGPHHQEAALAAWADEMLETSPEVTERFDTEPYELLGESLPYLWGPDDFVTWAKSMGALS